MLPFCGYNMADYFGHWLEIGRTKGAKLPRIFMVNWFRKSDDGKFLWPGFGENSRVLAYVLGRLDGEGDVKETPIGLVPTADALPLDGLDIPADTLEELLDRRHRAAARAARRRSRSTSTGSAIACRPRCARSSRA